MHIHLPKPGDLESMTLLEQDLGTYNDRAVLLLSALYGKKTDRPLELSRTLPKIPLIVGLTRPRDHLEVAVYSFMDGGLCDIRDHSTVSASGISPLQQPVDRTLRWLFAAKELVEHANVILLEAVTAPQRIREFVSTLVIG